jgi:hypothetical protein
MCGLAKKIAVPGVISVREILELYHVQTALIEGFQLASDVPDPLREQLLQNGMEAFVHDSREDTLRTMRLYLQAYEAAIAKP